MRVVAAFLFLPFSLVFPQTSVTASGGSSGTGQTVVGPISRTTVTTGAPYSADAESQTVRILADGARVTDPVHTWKLFRDAEGRTRDEHPAAQRPPLPSGADPNQSQISIVIHDPIAHYTYNLDPVHKVVHRHPLSPRNPLPNSASDPAPESLGTQTIEGLLCQGAKTTTIDNVTTELWKSSDLQLIVLSKVNIPLSSERTQKLFNISRAEPPASLFQPPRDYTLEDDPVIGSGGGTGMGKTGAMVDGAYSIGGDVSAPTLVSKREPQYSDEARNAKISGSTLLSIIIDPEGIPHDITVLRPLGYGLDEKAIEAVTQWRFKPALKGGVPVPVRAKVEVSFRLLTKPN